MRRQVGRLTRRLGALVLLAAGIAVASAVLTVDRSPTTVDVGLSARMIAIDRQLGYALVVAAGDHSAAVVDLGRATLVGRAIVGPDPSAAAVDEATGTAYVLSSVDPTRCLRRSSIAAIDLRSARILRTVAGPLCASGLALDPRAHRFYVSDSRTNSITGYDTRSGTVRERIPAGGRDEALLLLEAGRRGTHLLAALHSRSPRGQPDRGAIAVITPSSGRTTARVSNIPWPSFVLDPAHERLFILPASGSGQVAIVDLGTGRRARSPFRTIPADYWYQDHAAGRTRVLRSASDGARAMIVDPATGSTIVAIGAPWVTRVVAHDGLTDRYLILGGARRTRTWSRLILVDGRSGRAIRTLGSVCESCLVEADWEAGRVIATLPASGANDSRWEVPGTDLRIPNPFARSNPPSVGEVAIFQGLR